MNASARTILMAVTLIAVISDSILLPFYPQFFADVFGITDAHYVGWYLAAYGLAVMLAFPCWAALTRLIPSLRLLVITQLIAGLLSLACYWAASPAMFWMLSLGMMVFKASYLLIYPLIMALENKHRHGNTIGMLSVIVNFGAIAGALIGGVLLQWMEPRQAFIVMAAGDFLQMAVCLWMLRTPMPPEPRKREGEGHAETPRTGLRRNHAVALAAVMLAFYFSAYLVYHFFVSYWQSVSAYDGEIASAVVFAIPAFMALAGVWVNARTRKSMTPFAGIVPLLALGAAGLLLQSSAQDITILIGRCLFGWALFQSLVRLDLLIFHLSTPQTYAADFSKIRFFQSLGVMSASYAAGTLSATYGLQSLFWIAATGLLMTAAIYVALFKAEVKATAAVSAAPARERS